MILRYAVCFKVVSFLCRSRSRCLLVFLFLASVMLIAASGCEKREVRTEQQERPVDVTVTLVEARDVPVSFEYVAQVQSSRQVSIQARVSGFLDKRVYTEGAIVKEGQTLFVMDQKPFKVQLDQAEASLARQEAAFEVARRNLARVKPLVAQMLFPKRIWTTQRVSTSPRRLSSSKPKQASRLRCRCRTG